jgi:hypothetical protein
MVVKLTFVQDLPYIPCRVSSNAKCVLRELHLACNYFYSSIISSLWALWAGLWAEIWTQDLSNMNQECKPLNHDIQSWFCVTRLSHTMYKTVKIPVDQIWYMGWALPKWVSSLHYRYFNGHPNWNLQSTLFPWRKLLDLYLWLHCSTWVGHISQTVLQIFTIKTSHQ